MAKLRVGILGFGEAGQSVAAGLRKSATADHPIEISTWDILLPSNEKGAPLKAAADKIGVRTVGSAAELAQVSDRQFVGFRLHQPIRHELCSCLPVFALELLIVPGYDSRLAPELRGASLQGNPQWPKLAGA